MPGRAWSRLAAAAVFVGALGVAPAGDGLLPASGEASYRTIEANVARHGWACVWVGDTRKSGWAYTVGLSGKHLPELLIVTSDDENASCTMLNVIANKMIAHQPPIPDGYEPLGHAVRLNTLYAKEFLDRCVMAGVWAFRHHTAEGIVGMQVVFADDKGHFPG